MKKCFLSFTTLFIALNVMPVVAFADDLARIPDNERPAWEVGSKTVKYKNSDLWCLRENRPANCEEHDNCIKAGNFWNDGTNTCVQMVDPGFEAVAEDPNKRGPLTREAKINTDTNIRLKEPKQDKNAAEQLKRKIEKDNKSAQQEICNDAPGAKWKNGKCVCEDAKLSWDSQELECNIAADRPYKQACEKVEGGRWVTRGNTSTCLCPEPEEMWNRETKTCRVDDDEEEIVKPVSSGYESQKPFVEDGAIKQHFIIYKLLSGKAKAENDTEFTEWKQACETVGKQNHVKTVKIVTTAERNDIKTHSCFADTCDDGYKASGEWPICTKDDAATNNFIAAVKTISDTFDNIVKSKKEELCKSQQQPGPEQE